jgi:hypothetical protein
MERGPHGARWHVDGAGIHVARRLELCRRSDSLPTNRAGTVMAHTPQRQRPARIRPCTRSTVLTTIARVWMRSTSWLLHCVRSRRVRVLPWAAGALACVAGTGAESRRDARAETDAGARVGASVDTHARVGMKSLSTEPHLTDWLYVLARRQLSDGDPVRTHQAIQCEYGRIADAVGSQEASRRVDAMYDTTYRTRADSVALRRAEASLGQRVFGTGSPVCDPFDSVSVREVRFTHVAPPDSLDLPPAGTTARP